MSKGYGQYCPIARTLELLGDKWTLLIVRELLRGKRRFKDIELGLRGIPPNLLSDRLKVLEQANLVTRQYYRELPPRVEYCLTDKGESLEKVLESIASWGMDNLMTGEVACEQVDLDLFFFHLPRFFNADYARGVSATFEVQILGSRGGTWFVTIEQDQCHVSRELLGQPDVRLVSDADTWVDVLVAHPDPCRLIGLPAVQLEGDKALAARFGSFFCREAQMAAPELASAASASGSV
jgi:DNA-binding HxlR family transcriptional regulator